MKLMAPGTQTSSAAAGLLMVRIIGNKSVEDQEKLEIIR
jgi:hypothetical protein